MKKRSFNRRRMKDSGTTLVEIVVTFALLGIFLAAAAAIIGVITNQYYNVKGETYSKQVTDIVMEKIASEVEGAKYYTESTIGANGEEKENSENPIYASDYQSMEIHDRTDTRVKLSAVDGKLRLDYFGFYDTVTPENSREATAWEFDRGVYNGYTLEELYFIRGDKLGEEGAATIADRFSFPASQVTYGKEITVIFVRLNSPKYGNYYSYRVVRMYNVPEA